MQLSRCLKVTKTSERCGEIVHRDQGEMVVVAEYSPARRQGLLMQLKGVLKVSEGVVDRGKVDDRL
jgi:hypothetical protein